MFITNSNNKILGNDLIEWKYKPTKENPADISRQGNPAHKLQSLNWVKNILDRPKKPFVGPTAESLKIIRW